MHVLNRLSAEKKKDGRHFLEIENLRIDLGEHMAKVDNQPLDLNRKELDILIFLLMNKNRIARKTAIAENVWGDYIDQANDFDFIYSQIKNLRKKLRSSSARVEIKAVYGMGYKLTSE